MEYSYIAAAVTGVLVLGITVTQLNTSPATEQVYSPEYVANNSQALTGQNITVKGKIVQGPQVCTQMYCGPDNPCCNTCSSSVYIGEGQEIQLQGKNIGCSGNSCSMNCTPESGKVYQIRGVLQEDNDELALEVIQMRRADE